MRATIRWPRKGCVSTLLAFIKVNPQQQAASPGKTTEHLREFRYP